MARVTVIEDVIYVYGIPVADIRPDLPPDMRKVLVDRVNPPDTFLKPRAAS